MKEIGKSVRFFGWINGKMLLIVYGFVLLFPLLFALMDGEKLVESYISTLQMYTVILGPMMLFIQSAVSYMHYLNVSVSMGSTRKNALTGMLIAYYLMLGLIVIVTLGLWQVLPDGNKMMEFVPAYLGMLLVVNFTTNIVGTTILKAGIKAGFVVYMITYFIVLAVAGVMIAISPEDGITVLAKYVNSIWVPIGGLVLSLVSLIGPYWGVRKFEVRA